MLHAASYPKLQHDPDIKKLIEAFKKELDQLSKDIAIRNADLTFPYTFLDPKNIGNSIFI